MQEWISIKDHLPKHHENVLFLAGEDRQVYPGYFVAAPARGEESNFLGVFRIGYYSGKAIDLLTSTFNVWAHNDSDVLYWQPFPPAPGNEANE